MHKKIKYLTIKVIANKNIIYCNTRGNIYCNTRGNNCISRWTIMYNDGV